MRRISLILSTILLLSGCGKNVQIPTEATSQLQTKGGISMILESLAFAQNGALPAKYTCDGDNISPPLQIKNVPDGAQSLVLIMDDPDAPRGTWVHWLVWNIAPETAEILEDNVPGVEGTTDYGRPGYDGPCPPSGTHRYFFRLYALDTKLELVSESKKIDVERAMSGHVLESVELISRYQRQQH